MATLTNTGFPTLATWAKQMDPDGSVAMVINVLSEKNEVMQDIPWVEGNLPTGHLITQANSLPTPSWRQFNAGVTPTKAETAQYVEQCGMLDDESIVDIALAELNGNEAEFRAAQDKMKMEGYAQEFVQSVFYESITSNPDRIHGLAPRYSATTGITPASYVLAGTNADTNCHSVWLITWEPGKIFGIFPKGSQAGLKIIDRGVRRVLDGNSNPFFAYSTQFTWKCGVAVADYRYAVRIQWDPDDAQMADSDNGLLLKMQEAIDQVFEVTPHTRFYMNRTSKKKFHAQLASNESRLLTYTSPDGDGGKLLEAFMGVPIRTNDGLVAETAIS